MRLGESVVVGIQSVFCSVVGGRRSGRVGGN